MISEIALNFEILSIQAANDSKMAGQKKLYQGLSVIKNIEKKHVSLYQNTKIPENIT